MRVLIGIAVIFASVLGGYLGQGGHFEVLIQPFEALIIIGAAAGAFIIGNTGPVLKQSMRMFGTILKGPRYNKAAYKDLLGLQFTLFKLVQQKGVLALEEHIENPEESRLFQSFPSFMKHHHAVEFLCDYLRMMTLGTENANEVETLIDAELEAHHAEQHNAAHAVQLMADGMPALGIVAAVLGVIHTMGSITEPPEVLGELIGAALVGTFFGVLMSYGFVAPLGGAIAGVDNADSKYFQCIKAGLLAHMQGYPPAVSIEFARKVLWTHDRPSFYEVEEAVSALPAV